MALVTTLWEGREQSTLARFTVTLLLMVTAPNLCGTLLVLPTVLEMTWLIPPRRIRLGRNLLNEPVTVTTGPPFTLLLSMFVVWQRVWVFVKMCFDTTPVDCTLATASPKFP